MGFEDVFPQTWEGNRIGGVAIDSIVEEFGTPVYVVDEGHVRDRLRAFNDSFGPDTVTAYAAKAFFCVEMARLVAEAGWWVDVVSAGELATALAGGVPAKRLMVHGNVKTDAEIAEAIRVGVGRLVVDDPDEMGRIKELAKGRPVRTLLRLNIEVGADTHPKIRTTGHEAQFGMTLDEAEAALAQRSDTVTVHGVHIHIGSQLRNPKVHLAAFEAAADFVEQHRSAFSGEIVDIDVGGGFGVAYLLNDEPVALDQFADRLIEAVGQREGLRLMIEPGRAVIAQAGVTLYRVISMKGTDRPFLAVDGGLSDNPRPALYDADYEMRSVSRFDDVHDRKFRVVGRHCETSDKLGELDLPSATRPGDIVVVPGTGAYAFSMASRYNMLPRRPVIFVRDGQARVAVAGETTDDIVR